MTRSLAITLVVLLAGAVALLGPHPLAAQDTTTVQAPAAAVIRGENIWLRFDPAEPTDIIAILQRGDEITITGAAVSADGYTFYPVEVLETEETGWVRTIFVDPGSIIPLVEVAPEPDVVVVEPRPEPDIVVVEPEVEVVPVPVEEEPERPRRQRDDRQAEEEPVVDEPVEDEPVDDPAADDPADAAAPDAETIRLTGEGATTTEPVVLEARRYRVRALVEASEPGSFVVDLIGPEDFSEVVFDDAIEEVETFITRTAVRLDTPGEYTIDVSGTDDPWIIEFLPR